MKIIQFHQFESSQESDDLLGLLGYEVAYRAYYDDSHKGERVEDFDGEITSIQKFEEEIGEDYYLVIFKITHADPKNVENKVGKHFNLVVALRHLKKLLEDGSVKYKANNVSQWTFNSVTLTLK